METAPQRVAIFDFDATLAADEISFIDSASMIDRGFGGAERVQMLAAMLAELKDQHGIALAVCSLNARDVILQALEDTGLLQLFGERPLICDRSDWMRFGSLKSQVITRIILPQLGGNESSTLFVDDDPANVQDVRLRARGVTSILVPRPTMKFSAARGACLIPNGGIGKYEAEQILAWARTQPAVTPPRPHLEDGREPERTICDDGAHPLVSIV